MYGRGCCAVIGGLGAHRVCTVNVGHLHRCLLLLFKEACHLLIRGRKVPAVRAPVGVELDAERCLAIEAGKVTGEVSSVELNHAPHILQQARSHDSPQQTCQLPHFDVVIPETHSS